jgi:hypothetical protein
MFTVSDGKKQLLIPASQLFVLLPDSKFVASSSEEKEKSATSWDHFLKLSSPIAAPSLATSKVSEGVPVPARYDLPSTSRTSAVQCDSGQFVLYDYEKKSSQCFALKGWEKDASPELKKQKVAEYYRNEMKATNRQFEEVKSQVYAILQRRNKASIPWLTNKWAQIRTSERGALRLANELLLQLQMMELECQQLSTNGEIPYSFCMMDQGFWKVTGSTDTFHAVADAYFAYLQRVLHFWHDVYNQMQKKSTIKQDMTEIDVFLLRESHGWTQTAHFIIAKCKEKEEKLLETHRLVDRGLKLLKEVYPRNPQEATTHLNLGLSLLDDVSQNMKIEIQAFFESLPSLQSLDLMNVWNLTGFITSMFLVHPPSSWITSQETWNTLLGEPVYVLKTRLPPLFAYYFGTWGLLADPIIMPSTNMSINKSRIQTVPSRTLKRSPSSGTGFRFSEDAESEILQEKAKDKETSDVDELPFRLLSFIPCDMRLTSHLHKLPTPELSNLNLHVYKFHWNHFAFDHFGLQGESKQFLGHELEAAMPGSVKHVHDFLCLRVGIFKFYLDYVVPLQLQHFRPR